MKFKLYLISLALLYTTVRSQYLVYPFYNKNNLLIEHAMHTDSLAHTSIKPYLIELNKDLQEWNIPIFQLNSNSKTSFSAFPIVCTKITQNKDYCGNGGVFLGAMHKNILSIQVQPEYFFMKPNSYLTEMIDSIGVLPSVGIPTSQSNNHYKKFYATGNIHLHAAPFLWFDGGYGKHFIGDGERSLFLSSNTSPYTYLKGTAKKWNIQYIVLYSFLNEPMYKNFTNRYTRKNSTLHYLSWNIKNRFTINAFETVIWQVNDSIGNRNFDINYLNPIIFFRPIEFSIGSPDNVLMGAGFKFRLFKSTFLYSQFILDEFKLSEWKSEKHWWGNKYGLQLGIKSFSLIQKNLFFVRTEFNMVRPFTYAHHSYLNTWGHLHQPLAHPLGANFIEWLGQISYHYKKWQWVLYSIYSRQGVGNYWFNAGNNIYRSYNDNRQDYGNYMLIGSNVNTTLMSLAVYWTVKSSWQLQLFVKFDYLHQFKEQGTDKKNYFLQLGITTRGITCMQD